MEYSFFPFKCYSGRDVLYVFSARLNKYLCFYFLVLIMSIKNRQNKTLDNQNSLYDSWFSTHGSVLMISSHSLNYSSSLWSNQWGLKNICGQHDSLQTYIFLYKDQWASMLTGTYTLRLWKDNFNKQTIVCPENGKDRQGLWKLPF